MKYKKIGLFAASFALVASMFSGVVFSPLAFAATQTCVWTGTAGDNKFSTAGNWTGCGGSVPQDGDVVNIDYANVVDQQVITNDLNVALAGLAPIDGPSGQQGKYIAVTALKMADGGIIGKSGYTGASLYINIATTMPSSYATVTGLGNVTLKQFIAFGNIVIPGALTIAANENYSYSGGDDFSSLIINADGSVNFYADDVAMAFNKPITLNGGVNAALTFGAKCQTFANYSCAEFALTTWTLGGAITVNAATLIDTDTNAKVIFTGAVNDKTLLSNGSNANGTFQFGTTAEVLPVTTVNFDGDAPTTSVNVLTNQIGILSGKRQNVSVYGGGVLKGTGSLAGQLYIDNGGIVAPGNSPGCLTSESLTLSGEYQFELGGTDACTGYDQLVVLNTADAAQPVLIDNTTAILTTSRYNGYTPEQGDEFVIIDLAGNKAINGTFKDLPEGATFTQNGIVFKISYVGGDGNDVTLTVMNSPTAPDTGFLLLQSNPALVAIIVAAAAVAMVVFARKLQTTKR